IGWDDLLDALTFARGGTWESFVSITTQIDDSPWFPAEAARSLSALAHIDLQIDENQFRPRAWSIAPPVLAFVDSELVFLCGSRPRRLLTRLGEDADAIGGKVEVTTAHNGPSLVRLHGLALEDVTSLAASVESALGMSIRVIASPAERVLSVLPT